MHEIKRWGGKEKMWIHVRVLRIAYCSVTRLKQKCTTWNQNCSDRRWNQAALTLKPPGCSAELLCTQLLACKWEGSCYWCGKEMVWTIPPTEPPPPPPRLCRRALLYTHYTSSWHAGQVRSTNIRLSSAAEGQAWSSGMFSKYGLDEFTLLKMLKNILGEFFLLWRRIKVCHAETPTNAVVVVNDGDEALSTCRSLNICIVFLLPSTKIELGFLRKWIQWNGKKKLKICNWIMRDKINYKARPQSWDLVRGEVHVFS